MENTEKSNWSLSLRSSLSGEFLQFLSNKYLYFISENNYLFLLKYYHFTFKDRKLLRRLLNGKVGAKRTTYLHRNKVNTDLKNRRSEFHYLLSWSSTLFLSA